MTGLMPVYCMWRIVLAVVNKAVTLVLFDWTFYKAVVYVWINIWLLLQFVLVCYFRQSVIHLGMLAWSKI